MSPARHLQGKQLADALMDSRARTWELVDDLSPAQWLPPYQLGVNPVAWELAHTAWFAEFWILRGPHHCDDQGFMHAAQPARHAAPDPVLDSARLAHAQRWTAALPTREQLRTMLDGQLQACINALPAIGDDAALYFHRLALAHEDMHAEAYCWMRAALAYPAPAGVTLPQVPPAQPLTVPAATTTIGWPAGAAGFAFDNESPALPVALNAFEIDSAPVRALDFARFVDAGGYDEARYWPHAAGAWRAQSPANHPQRWRRTAQSSWQMRWFDQWVDLNEALPALHVNAFEAEAYCLWAGRRLPTAAEWERAATTLGAAFHWGHSVWEWTASDFAPYPGFTPGPYHAYSQPWFGTHRELRGGAFATHARMHHRRYRNFFQPHRSDVFAGFRTVTL